MKFRKQDTMTANIPVSPRILSVGTKVVVRDTVVALDGGTRIPAGATGMVIQSPLDRNQSYRVRFPEGSEAAILHDQLTVLKEFQKERMAGPEVDLYDHILYRCIVGSRAYGLDDENSDTDRRGIYLPPAELHWSLYGVPEQLESLETEECYWELQKFLVLALKANPNILECLYTPIVEYASPLAGELLEMRSAFLSRMVYQTYNGYVLSQFKKLEQNLRTRGAIKWKHAMHLIRLLISGITVLQEGFVPVKVEDHHDQLLAIRRGQMPWDQVNRWRLDLHRQFEQAFTATALPECPDYERVNRFLIRARRSMVRDKE
jgi:predicted nucleotidyltransferase